MTKIPTGTIAWLVNREHVSASDTDIVRMLCRRMKVPGWTKALRKQAYRIGIDLHRQNQDMYRRVMSGRV